MYSIYITYIPLVDFIFCPCIHKFFISLCTITLLSSVRLFSFILLVLPVFFRRISYVRGLFYIITGLES